MSERLRDERDIAWKLAREWEAVVALLVAALERIDADEEWQNCGDSCVVFARPIVHGVIATAKGIEP